MDDLLKKYARDEEFRKDLEHLPYIQFPSEWLVKVIGPFAGASVRFLVKKDIKQDWSISVYADLHESLGFYDGPYWEIYPFEFDGYQDVYRCPLKDTEKLILKINEALENHKESKGE